MTDAERTVFEATWHLYEQMFPGESAHVPTDRTRIIVAEDFAAELRKHSSPEEIIEYDRVGWPVLNGITLPSRDPQATFTILLNGPIFNVDTYQHTIPHEMTHLSDYNFFFGQHGNLLAATEAEKQRYLFWPYYHWSEFHAKATGTKFYALTKWCELNGEWPKNGMLQFGQVEFRTHELVGLAEGVESSRSRDLDDTSDKFWAFVHGAMEYLGRMSVFQTPGSTRPPDTSYPEDVLKRIFGPKVLGLYPVLLQMTTAESAVALLPALQEVIEDLTTFLNVRTLSQRFGME